MDGPTNVMLAAIIIGLPVLLLMIIANRYFKLREKKLEIEARLAAEKAAQYASRSMELEQRVRVLEQIVTDAGAQTATQIEALRQPRVIENGDAKYMNPFEFVLALLVVLLVSRIVMQKMGIRPRSMREMKYGTQDDDETVRLRAQVKQLQDRINILERIVTDRGADTAAQIEALRERDRISEGDQG